MGSRARAILWAQWRSTRNRLPHSNRLGVAFTAVLAAVWYGGFTLLAIAAAFLMANPAELDTIARILPVGLLVCILYWQVMPLISAAMGSALDIKKLLAYPIPHAELFALDVLLRVSTGLEVLIVLLGTGAGLLANPKIPVWAPLGLVPFIALNLFLNAGIRDLLGRFLEHKRFREIAAFLFVIAAALPQAVIVTGHGDAMLRLFMSSSSFFWPWNATAEWLQGRLTLRASSILLAWTLAAYVFGRWQFERSLRFDAEVQGAATGTGRRPGSLIERFYRAPGWLLADPLAAIIEKDLRCLTRSARFRLVFIMGFSFGLLIWVPVTRTGDSASFMSQNYLTLVSIYALLLLSDVLFWNAFGFDRSAIQIYFLVPVRLSQVLTAKNIASMFFVFLEITAIALVCGVMRFPIGPGKLVEAYLVAAIVSVFLISIGNLTSVYNPRSMNPNKSFRSSAGGRTQALLVLLFPLAMLPVALAYLARYAFDNGVAFYSVLLVAAVLGGIFYTISMDSAVAAAGRRKERMIAALSRGEGPVES
jgi:ABC-2 type transport system permease protein